MLSECFRRFIPEPHVLREHRSLRWMGPALHHPRLGASPRAAEPSAMIAVLLSV